MAGAGGENSRRRVGILQYFRYPRSGCIPARNQNAYIGLLLRGVARLQPHVSGIGDFATTGTMVLLGVPSPVSTLVQRSASLPALARRTKSCRVPRGKLVFARRNLHKAGRA
jgi:hypothetical protein